MLNACSVGAGGFKGLQPRTSAVAGCNRGGHCHHWSQICLPGGIITCGDESDCTYSFARLSSRVKYSEWNPESSLVACFLSCLLAS